MKPRSHLLLEEQFPVYASLLRRDRRQRRINRIVHAAFYATVFVWSVWAGLILGLTGPL